MAHLMIALDFNEKEKLDSFLKEIEGLNVWVKVGVEGIYAFGLSLIEELKLKGFNVFADVKLHDIPRTVSAASKIIVKFGVDMLNVHCSGGKEMMKSVIESVTEESERLNIKRPIILGVTILTSLAAEDLGMLGIRGTVRESVLRLASLGKEAGLDGIISSAQEIKVVREYFGKDFVILTPGIRPAGEDLHDQKRVTTPYEAVKQGADFLVVGRPITRSSSPRETVINILKEIEEAEKN